MTVHETRYVGVMADGSVATVSGALMTPLERAARALFKYEPGPYGDCVEWAIEQDFGWRDQIDAVKLVLTAIREPSGAMKRAGIEACGGDGHCLDAYEAMIDAALAEGE